MKNKKVLVIVSIFIAIVLLAVGTSYALFRINITKNKDFKLKVGSLVLSISDNNNTFTDGKLIMNNLVPTSESEALSQTGYNFTLTNTGTIDANYKIYLDDATVTGSTRLSDDLIKVNITNTTLNQSRTVSLNELTNRIIDTGTISKNTTYNYVLRIWLDYNAGNDAANKYFGLKLRIDGTQSNEKEYTYTDPILNGADPVLTENLIPVTIDNNGTVRKADLKDEWYSYENKKWANVVVLKDKTIEYTNNQAIPESNIQSYFVWIPKYSYKIFDSGSYSNYLTSLNDYTEKSQPIEIKFGLNNTNSSKTDECTTPISNNQSLTTRCAVGKYMTHPAFITMDSNGIWVGKFETGYDGANSIEAAEVYTNNPSKIVIKPNTYSWRATPLGQMFKNCYDYLRNEDSHLMKNTEWGAMAYLSHSIYGTCTENTCEEIMPNNNNGFVTGYASTVRASKPYVETGDYSENRFEEKAPGVDGTYTVNYYNTLSQKASTTLNYSGIYDASGGSYEYVAAYSNTQYTTGAGDYSTLNNLYSGFYSNANYYKYWDKYQSLSWYNWYNSLLGDATGEMGPFIYQSSTDESVGSWRGDSAYFVYNSYPFFVRGGFAEEGYNTGLFSFFSNDGSGNYYVTYRIVLAPKEN